jgi:hypothetical protein
MTDITISRIQNRRGSRVDLPQPLAPGEFGLCEDTQELFVGRDPQQIPAGIRVFVNDSQQITAQNLLDNAVVVFSIASLLSDEDLETLKTDMESSSSVNQVSLSQFFSSVTSTNWLVASGRPQGGATTAQVQSVIAGTTVPGQVSVFLGAIVLNNTASSIALSTDGDALTLDHEYANSLAHAVNFAAGATGTSTGLITSNLNLKVITEAQTSSPGVISGSALNDFWATPVSIQLPQSASWASTGITYSTSESDVLIIDYSLSSIDYAASGKLVVAVLDGTANLSDDSTVINNTASGTIDMRATASGTSVTIEYRHDLVNPITFKTLTKRWSKF